MQYLIIVIVFFASITPVRALKCYECTSFTCDKINSVRCAPEETYCGIMVAKGDMKIRNCVDAERLEKLNIPLNGCGQLSDGSAACSCTEDLCNADVTPPKIVVQELPENAPAQTVQENSSSNLLKLSSTLMAFVFWAFLI
ncbi:hypothetical protein M3Y97_01088900 [Aphelenchoides bicaudatus]|nr:hypothetical protein M3Y97_01088900 [Aphelenchoides bicaudatus]